MKHIIIVNDWDELLALKEALKRDIRDRMKHAVKFRNTDLHSVYEIELNSCKNLGRIYKRVCQQYTADELQFCKIEEVDYII